MRAGSNGEPRSMQAIVIITIAAGGIVLSLKSALVLSAREAWTAAGWWLTILYFVAVIIKTTVVPAFPASVEYGILAALAAAFAVAGIRDERQAEPWWWPVRRGRTRAEQRGTRS